MLTDNDFYVILKLTTGENVMAVLRQEDEKHVLVEHPIVMRSVVNFEAGKEHLTAAPLCQFTDEIDFVIAKTNIMYIKKLHQVFIPHYKKIVNQHEKTAAFVSAESEEVEHLTPERARKSIEQLNAIFEDKEENDWEDKIRNLVPGNDTIN